MGRIGVLGVRVGWMDGWTDGRTDGRTVLSDGSMDVWKFTHVFYRTSAYRGPDRNQSTDGLANDLWNPVHAAEKAITDRSPPPPFYIVVSYWLVSLW